MARTKLSDDELQTRLANLPRWAVERGKLRRVFQHDNFRDAFGFMTKVALLAERADHHPEWSNVYGRVVIDLTTHDAAGITDTDITLATAIDAAFGK